MEFKIIPREKIELQDYQLRFQTGVEDIDDLVHSIEKHGLISPLSVRETGGSYFLIAGLRRLKATGKLGWKEIPCVVLNVAGDADVLIKGIAENMERLELSPLERAKGFEEIVERYQWTQDKLADQIGRRQAYVSQHINLLKRIHPRVLRFLHEGAITFGHARELMRLKDKALQLEIAEKIIAGNWNVQNTGLFVDQRRPPEELTEREKTINAIERDIRKAAGKSKWWKGVTIRQGRKKERLVVDFSSRPELKSLLRRLEEAL